MVDHDERVRAAVDSALRRHEARRTAPPPSDHPSHTRVVLDREPVNGKGDGSDDDAPPCLVEPAVRCTHCGFCVSLGF